MDELCAGRWCLHAGGGGPQFAAELHVGDVPAGTVFEATATYAGESASARSAPYLGRVSATAPPGLPGRLRVGALVRPMAARWMGGWGNERSYLQTQACRDRMGHGCVVIADQFYWNHCPGVGAVLDPRCVGWYVRAIDRRFGRDVAFPTFAVGKPEALRPSQPSPASGVATFGPIRPAAGPPESRCGRVGPWSRPRVRLLRKARLYSAARGRLAPPPRTFPPWHRSPARSQGAPRDHGRWSPPCEGDHRASTAPLSKPGRSSRSSSFPSLG